MKKGRFASTRAKVQGFFPALGYQQFDAHLDRLIEATHHAPPQRLCHYTTEAGLRGILQDRQLWAVDFRAQRTDELEMRHADSTVLSAASALRQDSALSEAGAFVLRVFLERYEAKKFSVIAAPDIFITCFCEQPDNPKLWRDFGNGNAGFAIELDVLSEKRDIAMGANFWRVEYETKAVDAHVRRVFFETLVALDAYMAVNELAFALELPQHDLFHATVRALFIHAALISSRHKAEHYAGDCEWRVCYLSDREARVPVHEHPKRHVKVPLRASADVLPSIRAIHVGNQVSAGTESSVRQFVASLGYLCPVVRAGA